jgi:hypothetical protein
VRAAVFSSALEIRGAAQDIPLAREADGGDACHDRGEAGRDRHGRMLQTVRDEAPVKPSLRDIAQVEAEALGDPIVVDAQGPAQVDRDAVDVRATKPTVVERCLERLLRGCEPKHVFPLVDAEGGGRDPSA